MSDRKRLIWPLINLIVAVVFGILTSFWIDGKTGFVVGLVAYFAVEMLRFSVWAEKIYEQYHRIATAISALQHADGFTDLLLLYGLRQGGWLETQSVSVGHKDVWRFWRDCIGRANNRWSAVSYTSAGETWDLAWRKTALAIQQERIRNDCVVERIFLVDSEDEWKSLSAVVEEQRAAGISVSWVLTHKVAAHTVASAAAKKLEAMDVAVVDDTWIYKTYLTDKRELQGCSATRDASQVEAAKTFVREVRGLATAVANSPRPPSS